MALKRKFDGHIMVKIALFLIIYSIILLTPRKDICDLLNNMEADEILTNFGVFVSNLLDR